jgi:hypothetical protein
MTRWSMGRHLLAAVLAASLAPSVAHAQATRAALLDSARVLILDFNEPAAIGVLRRALNPALGATDSAWQRGVHLLSQTLIQSNQRVEAEAWLRWAIRLRPDIPVDSMNFVPALVSAFRAARDFVTTGRSDPRAQFRYEWSTTTNTEGFGDLRVDRAPGTPATPLQIAVEGAGTLDPGRARVMATGSYQIAARPATGPGINVSAEVLPGITTIVIVSFAPAVIALDAEGERRVAAHLARIDATRMGETACAVGAVTGGSGLLLTSYRSIRGADGLAVQLPGSRIPSERVRVAAWDVAADVAVLSVGGGLADSLGVAVPTGTSDLWSAHFPACGTSPRLDRLPVASADANGIRLAADAADVSQSPLLVTGSGAVAGVVVTARDARPLVPAIGLLLASAQRNVGSGSIQTAGAVALREQHALGEVALRAERAGARARITPLERWQWPEAGRVDALPFTFRGPMGRYRVEVLDGESVTSSSEFTIEPSSRKQVALGVAPKRRSMTLPIVGGLVAGGLAFALLSGGDGPPPPSTGGISIRLP